MKTFNYIIILFMSCIFSSCLNGNLEDLPEYNEANITSVSTVRYRYIGTFPGTTEPAVKEVDLTYSATIDEKTSSVTINVTVPSSFPSSELKSLSASKLVVAVGLSTAARVAPVASAPAFGVPGDWSNPNKYIVTAANKTTKEWTVKLILTK